VHVGSAALPPRAATIGGRLPCPDCIEARPNQMLRASKWALPVPPEQRAQLAPDPAIELFQHPTFFYESEVGHPTAEYRVELIVELIDDLSQALATRAAQRLADLLRETLTTRGAIFSFGFLCHVTL
jgi:hypothetical protein